MDFAALKYLDELDVFIDDLIKQFGQDVNLFEAALFERLQGQIAALDLRSGNIQQTAKNLRAITQIRKELYQATKPEYSQAIRNLLNGFSESSLIINGYFTALVGEATAPVIMQAILTENIALTADLLLSGGLNAQYLPGINNILHTHITTGAPVKALRQTLQKYVIEDATLARHSSVIADDAVNTFSRNYIQEFAEDLNLEHYFFKGTVIETSRIWCQKKTGKYFTSKEVEQWGKDAAAAEAKNGKAWAGVKRGTNATTIKTNLGGHGCRHRLAPITKQLYIDKTSNKT